MYLLVVLNRSVLILIVVEERIGFGHKDTATVLGVEVS